jgi:1-acyl-sn-glycerol-3-phosphate acyltransferase
VLVAVGGAAGSWLAGWQGNSYRCLGLVPWSATGLLAALAWVVLGGDTTWACLLMGLMTGLANVPLRAFYQAAVPPDARGNGMAVMNTAIHLGTTTLAGGMFLLVSSELIGPALTQLALLVILAAMGALLAWRWLARESVEQVLQLIIWPMYRVRPCGPGLSLFPRQGPVLVFANHTCWLDPFWLIQEMPRPLTPMMLNVYFDLPVIHWFATHVFHMIRVVESGFRRQAPELNEAVAALDRAQCVLIFPEGWLQRREGDLRRFAQGIWHILQQRPNTPVIACWIEGGFGSFTSHAGGPPTKNKWPDLRRLIEIGVNAPLVLDPALLEDGPATRQFLREACLEARRHLGLKPLELRAETQRKTNDLSEPEA